MTNIIQSGGWPVNYPYATSSPLPSAILRPLQQPIYDTESTPAAGTAFSEMIFFQRQVGQTMAFQPSQVKTTADTNLQQPGQLPNPLEFSLFGFLVEMQPGIAFSDFNVLYTTGQFIFTYTGNRIYLNIPMTRIPQGISPEGFAGAASTALNVHNGVGHVSNLYKFTIGRAALRIRPTESFQIRLNWNSALGSTIGSSTAYLPALTAAIRIRVYLVGLTWTAL